jgi:1-acylglycerone phosphate reductase
MGASVHVLTIMTGGVRSSIVRSEYAALPENSLYQPIKEFWLQRVGLSQKNPMDTEAYAKSVVKQILSRGGRTKKWFWQGHFSWTAWFLNTFFWKGFTVSDLWV